jgi:DNA-binding SARP family transcriptional activator/predicted ATPase
MGHLAIFALGPLRVELDGQPLQTSRHKALALLVYLAMACNGQARGSHSRAALASMLWPEYSQQKAYAYLRRTLWEIRNILGAEWLDTDRDEVRLHEDVNIQLDVAEFLSHLDAINQHKHLTNTLCQECIIHLRTATLLYRGDFMAGFSLRDSVHFDDWQFFQQEALRRDYAEALQKLATLYYQQDLYRDALSVARRWLALDTFNEEAHRLLMKIYVQDGQRHSALRQFQECRGILKTELDIEPEPATIRLHETISAGAYQPQTAGLPLLSTKEAQGIQAGLTASAPGERHSGRSNNLPVPATPLVGRRREVEQISARLSDPDCWLLTLLGPGGIGKTRLAVEAGYHLKDDFPQGVFWVSLSMVQNELSLVPAIANTLGIVFRPDGSDIQTQLFDFLREKRLLFILDSFEGLVPWAETLAQLHASAPGIKLLITSRRTLRIPGEQVIPVKGLAYPVRPEGVTDAIEGKITEAYSAVALFIQTARRVGANFQTTPTDLAAICQITRLLEGMPLALELAASWVHTLPCQEIERMIRAGLDMLETPLGDIPERQRSMRAVFNYSWDLLSSRERVSFARLSVFRGSYSRQAARQIIGISLQTLSALIDQSLVRRAANGRFDMHDLLRQFCAGKLAQRPADHLETHQRHCHYYATRLFQWNLALGGVMQGQALSEMEYELENLQAAWDWAAAQKDVDALASSVDSLCMYYFRRARFNEGIQTCQGAWDAIHRSPSPHDPTQQLRFSSKLCTWRAAFSLNLERLEEASQYLQDSQAILDSAKLDPQDAAQERIFWLVIRAIYSNLRMDGAAALADLARANQLSQRTQGKYPRFLTFYWRFLMGGGAVTKEIYTFLVGILADVRRIGDPFELGCHLFTLGIGALFHEYDLEKAKPLLEESIRSFQMISDPSTEVMTIKTRSYLVNTQGNFSEGLELKKRELQIVQESGDRRMLGIVQAEIGEIFTHLGDYLRAEAYLRTGIGLLDGRSDYEVALRHRYLGDALLAQGKDEAARDAYLFSYTYFQGIEEKGWMLTALTGLSRAELVLGEDANARQHARQALQLYQDMGQLYTFFAYLTVAEIAMLLADQGEIMQALVLNGLVQRQGFLARSRWFADLFGSYLEKAARGVVEEDWLLAQQNSQSLDFSQTATL